MHRQNSLLLSINVCFDMSCNTKKTMHMLFWPKQRDRYIVDAFPTFTLNGCNLNNVSQFKYLGHVICDTLKDNEDITWEIQNLYVHTNMLINRFSKSSKNVKLMLFRCFRLSMYDVSL